MRLLYVAHTILGAVGMWQLGRFLLLYANPEASPGAFLVGGTTADLPILTAYPGCSNDRLLRKDLAPLARIRQAEPVNIARSGGRIDVTVPPGGRPRVLILAEMFRPEWTAATEDGFLAAWPRLSCWLDAGRRRDHER